MNEMSTRPVTVAESAVFVRQAADLWGDKDRDAFIDYIAQNPEAGDTIPDTGGVRKIRWSRPGMGKRGGVRVIYFYHDAAMPLYLLLIYAKAQQENWTPEDRRRVRTVVDAVKLLHGRS